MRVLCRESTEGEMARAYKAAERTVGALWDRIGSVLDAYTPAECANYFSAAGYEPD